MYQSTKKRYQGPWRAWSNGVLPGDWALSQHKSQMHVLTFLTETVTHQLLEYRTLALYKSGISQGHLPVGKTKLEDLPVVSRLMGGNFLLEAINPSIELKVGC